jgi:hypothetical protein
MNRLMTNATSFLALAPALTAACLTGSVPCFVPRTPHGIYALVNVNAYLTQYETMNPSPTTAQIETYFATTVYPGLLGNPDVSGITLYVRWSRLNPYPAPSPLTPPGHFQYDWSLVQDLLDQAGALKKTVQLVVQPGINSPTWLLGDAGGKNNGFLKSCNYLFDPTYKPPPAGTECGKVTFSGFTEGGWNPVKSQDVPMPWNSTYKNAWQTFLTALAAQFEGNPSLVSIAVAGPTASSEEMSLPVTRNTHGVAQIGNFSPEQMWNTLLAHHYTSSAYKDYTKYLNTDVAFIDEWVHAIDMFGKTFSGITLTLSTGDGLPNLGTPPAISTSPIDFTGVCPSADVDCAAETTILNYFIQSTVGGPNAKAYQVDGMKGSGSIGNLGVHAVKLLSLATDLFTSASQRILGGAQFVTPFATEKAANGISDEGDSDTGGCPSTCLAEQAEYNLLAWFFDGTSQGLSFPTGTAPMIGGVAVGGHSGSAPLNYLQIYGKDITYATTDAFGKVPVMMGGTPTSMSAQDLLHKASLALAAIAEY